MRYLKLLLISVAMVAVGVLVINRVPPLRRVVFGA